MPEPARYIVSDNFCFEVSTRELFRIENDDSTKLLPLGSRAADMLLLFLQRPGDIALHVPKRYNRCAGGLNDALRNTGFRPRPSTAKADPRGEP
jgi:hypothetical protein